MAKTKISQYDATAANNTDIDSINIAEGMAPSNVNNAIRELMAHLKDMDAGTQALTSPQLTSADINGGTLDGVTIGGASAGAGTFTNLTATGTTTLAGASTSADITFGDNDKAVFGAGSDLQIYHDGSDSFITDTGAGNLQIWGGNFRLRSSDGSEAVIDGNSGGAVTLYYDNSPKLATSSSGVDISGTLTSDGLTVDGNVALENADFITFKDTGGSSRGILTFDANNDIVIGPAGAGIQDIKLKNNGAKTRLDIDVGGDISFYEDTGTTAKFFWDASAEALQLGSTTSDESSLFAYKSSATYPAITVRQDGSAPIQKWLGASGAERMRIDSSGNLLVGKSDTSLAVAGARILPTGQVYSTASGAAAFAANRLSSDGAIMELYKDTGLVGSIGANSGYMYLGSGDTGLYFNSVTNQVYPVSATGGGSNEDGTQDLGRTTARFKDLYLSGGVYLGGTGSANKLDDYEEGTWTPTIGAVTLTNAGRYTKIGNLVFIAFGNQTGIAATSVGFAIVIGGLPFALAVSSDWPSTSTVSATWADASNSYVQEVATGRQQNDNQVVIYNRGSAATTTSDPWNIAMVYRTT